MSLTANSQMLCKYTLIKLDPIFPAQPPHSPLNLVAALFHFLKMYSNHRETFTSLLLPRVHDAENRFMTSHSYILSNSDEELGYPSTTQHNNAAYNSANSMISEYKL